jgi:hypothetical protein
MCQAVDEMIEDGRNICRRDGKSGRNVLKDIPVLTETLYNV